MADLTITPANTQLVNGVPRQGVFGETITQGKALYYDPADSKWKLARADNTHIRGGSYGFGIALSGGSDGQMGLILEGGEFNPGGAVIDGQAYAVSSTTPGGIAEYEDLATDDIATIIGYGTAAGTIKALRSSNALEYRITDEAYIKRIKATEPIGIWKLDEGAGVAALDSYNYGLDGVHTGVTWDNTKTPYGSSAPAYDGANDQTDIDTAGLESRINLDEGCMFIWARVANVGVWTDGLIRQLMRFRSTTAGNELFIAKSATSNRLYSQHYGDSNVSAVAITSISTTDWFNVMLSWSVKNDVLRIRLDGASIDSTTMNPTNTSSPALNIAKIGATGVSSQVWNGWLGVGVLYDRPEDTDIIALATL